MLLLSGIVLCFFINLEKFVDASESRIVGGEDAQDGEFPYQVSLRLYNRHFCGGSILTENYILTAAHCVDGQKPDNMTAVVGTNTLSTGGNIYEVEKLVPHPGYISAIIVNDIAVIKLKTNITYGDKIKPVKLADADTPSNTNLTLSGWGMTSYPAGNSSAIPDKLQTIDLVSMNWLRCKAEHITIFVPILPTNICTAGFKSKGACRGDSGGPLVDQNRTQVGVVSWGIPCGKGNPDVYTKVLMFLDWIKEQIKK